MIIAYVASLVLFLITYRFIYILNHYTLQTKATIIDVDRNGPYYEVKVQYTVDEKIIQGSATGKSNRTFKFGSELMIRVNPNKPEKFTIDSKGVLIYYIIFYGLLGMSLFYLTIIELIRIL